MLIKEIMETDIAECTDDTSLAEVYALIQSNSHRHVVVVDSIKHRVPIGIVTEHSICEKVVNEHCNTRDLEARSVMSTQLLRVTETSPVTDCAHIIMNDSNAIVLIVDDRRRLRGVVEIGTFREACERQGGARRTSAVFSGVPGNGSTAVEIMGLGWVK